MIDGAIFSGQGMAEPFGAAGHASSGDAASGAANLTFDADEYLPLLAGYDLTKDQARDLLAALWNIMRACVELGISVDVCGELGIDALPVLSTEIAPLDSQDRP